MSHPSDETSAFLRPDGSRPPVRYIKLGAGGAWAGRSLGEGEIHFGHGRVPHDLALGGDSEAVKAVVRADGFGAGKAADFAREVTDFYSLGPDAIWITFHQGSLWWARAEPEVIPAARGAESGDRFRRTIGPWRNTDVNGRVLREEELSTRLTKVAAYRQTQCRVQPEAEAYLLRKLAGEEEPVVLDALAAKATVTTAAERLIEALHWRDFETLVDVLMARAGWHRTSALGGTMKDADLIVEQAVTGETALVQVKSTASQATLDDYVARFDGGGLHDRLIFACHSPRGTLVAPADRPEIIVWTDRVLAETSIRYGLLVWLIERNG